MNQKELQEIRRQLKFENDRLHLIGLMEAYGKNKDGEASIKYTRSIDPELLEKEEGELYFEIFKKSLGGTFGKNLQEYTLDSSLPEQSALKNQFYNYKNGSLMQEKEFNQLVTTLLEQGDYRNSVLITAGVFEYSAPGLSANNEILEESSSFRFFIVAVSESKLTELGLIYSQMDNSVMRKVNTEMQIVPGPLDAIFYPSFSGRSSDVNHFLYHSKTAKHPNVDLIESYFHIPFVSTASEQSEGFAKVITDVFPQGLEAATVMKFHQNVADYIEENSQEDAQVMVDKNRVRDLLIASGADASSMNRFDSSYTSILEDQELAAINLMEKGKVSLKAPSISISVKDDGFEHIRTEEIDGRRCLVIEMDEGLEISGLPANLNAPKKEVHVIRPDQDAPQTQSDNENEAIND